jgi:hypothetical protein
MPTKPSDLTGQRFGRLVAIARTHERTRRSVVWVCLCDCGNTTRVPAMQLVWIHTRSCGCLRSGQNRTHGQTLTPEYRSWRAMKQRCLDAGHIGYHNYGGRGITVCDRWRFSFENFYTDMGKRPPETSLDRIDNNGNYEPGNCRWATRIEQGLNRRTTRARASQPALLSPHAPSQQVPPGRLR